MPNLADFYKPGSAPVTKAPTIDLSGSDIAAPHTALGKVLDQTGATLEKISEETAEIAGQEAGANAPVTRDENGNIKAGSMTWWPIVGPASAVFRREANRTFMNRSTPEIDQALVQARIDSNGDMEDFERRKKDIISGATKGAPNPVVGNLLAQHAEHAGSQHSIHMMEENDRIRLTNYIHSGEARIKGLEETMNDLAFQIGPGYENNPEYKKMQAERDQIQDEFVANQRTKIPQDVVTQQRQEANAKDESQSIIGDIVRKHQNKDHAIEAKREAVERFKGPGSEKLHLNERQRETAINTVNRLLENVDAQDKEEIRQNRANSLHIATKMLTNPGAFDQREYDIQLEASKKLGDWKSIDKLESTLALMPARQALGNTPPTEAGQILDRARAGTRPVMPGKLGPQAEDAIAKVAKEEGVEANIPFLRRTAWIESSGRADADRYTGHSYKGLYQHDIREWKSSDGDIYNAEDSTRAFVRRWKQQNQDFARDYGRFPDEGDQYLMHNQGTGGYRNHLNNPNRLAWQNMYNTFEGRQKGVGWAKAAIWQNLPSDIYGDESQRRAAANRMSSAEFVDMWKTKVGHNNAGKGPVSTVSSGSTEPTPVAPDKTPVLGGRPGHASTDTGQPEETRPPAGAPVSPDRPLDKQDIQFSGDLAAKAPALWGAYLAYKDQAIKGEGEAGLVAHKQLMHRITTSNDDIPDDELRSATTLLAHAGKYKEIEDIRNALNSRAWARGTLTVGEETGQVGAMRSQMEYLKEHGATELERNAFARFEEMHKQRLEGYKTNPFTQGANDDAIQQPQPINLNDPAAALAEIKRRDRDAGIINTRNKETGAMSLIQKNEEQEFANQIARTDPAKIKAFFTGLSQTASPDNYKATIETDTMKGVLKNLINTRNPDKVEAGMQVLDGYFRDHPSEFEPQFHEHTLAQMQYWQSYRGTANTMEEFLQGYNKAFDPNEKAGQAHLLEAAKKYIKEDMNDRLILKAYNQGYYRLIPNAAQRAMDWAVGGMPMDVGVLGTPQGEYFRQEFAKNFEWYSMQGFTPDQALQKIGEKMAPHWSPSHLNENRAIMKHAPESLQQFFQPIDGSYDWMQDQAEEMVRQHTYKVQDPDTGKVIDKPYGDPGHWYSSNWNIRGIVSDAQTEADIEKLQHIDNPKTNPTHMTPQYRLIVHNNITGQDDIIGGPNGYVWFDQKKAQRDFESGEYALRRDRVKRLNSVTPGQDFTGF